MQTSRDVILHGDILCVAKTQRCDIIIAIAYINVPAVYHSDNEVIGMYTIYNGDYETDIERDAEVIEYQRVKLNGELVEGTDKITQILQVIDEDLKESIE